MRTSKFGLLMAITSFAAFSVSGMEPQSDSGSADSRLFATILSLDTADFDDFNHCSSAARLQKHAD